MDSIVPLSMYIFTLLTMSCLDRLYWFGTVLIHNYTVSLRETLLLTWFSFCYFGLGWKTDLLTQTERPIYWHRPWPCCGRAVYLYITCQMYFSVVWEKEKEYLYHNNIALCAEKETYCSNRDSSKLSTSPIISSVFAHLYFLSTIRSNQRFILTAIAWCDTAVVR